MATPKETIWKCAPHTLAKHAILRRYLEAWFPILARSHDKVTFIDGFAGPGAYVGGEPGSPIVALTAARDHKVNLRGKVAFLFVEADAKRAAHLKRTVERGGYGDDFEIDIRNAEFSDVLQEELDYLDSQALPNVPIFAFIDPFGFSGVPYKLLARLLSRKRTEVFVLFARDAVNRFFQLDSVAGHISELFGKDDLAIPPNTERSEHLRELYEKRLREVAEFVGRFTIQDLQGRPIYDLFFASNNLNGFVKMKGAMWAADESGGFRFSDRNNPRQALLFKPDPTPTPARLIHKGGAGRTDISVARIETFVNEKTDYLPKHMRDALRQLEQTGRISVHPSKRDGTRRRRGSFPSGAIIDFT